jgi:Uma2 family endonuclease
MSTQTNEAIEKINRQPGEERMILHNVSWASYESLLADFANQGSPRLTYDQGTLEIMILLPEHEKINRTIASIVEVLAEELNIDILDLGSTTFTREELKRGFEPDSCFYFKAAALMRSKQEIDLKIDPAPELVIEVDITSGSLKKLPIYAKMGVSEIWRYDGKRLAIHILFQENYNKSNHSLIFPFITGDKLTEFIEQSETMTKPEFLKSLRKWIREQ